MQPVTLVLILLVIVELGLAGGLIWLRRRNRVTSGPILPRPIPARPPTPLTPQLPRPDPIAPEPVVLQSTPPVAAPRPFVLDLSEAPAEDEAEMDEARPVIPTALVLTWRRAGHPQERWHVAVDRVSEDTYAFAGAARRLDIIQVVSHRRVFHTLPFAHDRLLSAEDEQATPIPDIRVWLAGLEQARPGAEPLDQAGV